MKVELTELQAGMQVKLMPETPEDFSKVLRFQRNHRKEQPSISLHFDRQMNGPALEIFMRNVQPEKQSNSYKK